jgi:hypothetical protein
MAQSDSLGARKSDPGALTAAARGLGTSRARTRVRYTARASVTRM